MGIFTSKGTSTNLIGTLAVKSEQLRSEQAANIDLANYHARAASEASTEASVNAKHAEAVEQAFAILEEAGVSV